MKKTIKITAAVSALVMLFSAAACGADNSGTASETADSSYAATTDSTYNTLKGVFDAFLKVEDYVMYKNAYPNTTFEEKLDGNRIMIKASGSDDFEGSCSFPAKDGYLYCDAAADDYMSATVFNMLVSGVGEYYQINPTVFRGYLNGMSANGMKNEMYSFEENDDGTKHLQVYYAEKPAMKELGELYINDKTLEGFRDYGQDFFTLAGKVAVNGVVNREKGTLSFAIGEYGDKNTDLTYKSILEVVKFFQPNGYEEFLKNYTKLTSVSTDMYKVNTDADAFAKVQELHPIDSYTYMYVTFG